MFLKVIEQTRDGFIINKQLINFRYISDIYIKALYDSNYVIARVIYVDSNTPYQDVYLANCSSKQEALDKFEEICSLLENKGNKLITEWVAVL